MSRDGAALNLFYLGRAAEYLKLGDLTRYLDEIAPGSPLVSSLEAAVAGEPGWETKQFESIYDFRLYRILLYALVRDLRPAVFVETGVLHGLTSAFVLEALDRNHRGRLISVDLPSYHEQGPANRDGYNATLPYGREPGWVVVEDRRVRWELMLGRSDEILPEILPRVGPIDVFCHDSEHTYGTMWDELRLAWSALREGGVLVCDNLDANPSFFDFCRAHDRVPLVLPAPDRRGRDRVRFGLVRK